MNQKVLKTLEYHKILEQLAGYAAAPETKKRILELTPITDLDEINHLQETTKDALSRLYKSNNISFAYAVFNHTMMQIISTRQQSR